MSIESVMPSDHLTLSHALLLLPKCSIEMTFKTHLNNIRAKYNTYH